MGARMTRVTPRSTRLALMLAMPAFALGMLAAPPKAEAVPDHFYGVVAQALMTDEEYNLMNRAGVGTLRLQIGWPVVQAGKGRCQAGAAAGVCDWRLYDLLAGDAAERGIELFPYLLNVPPYIAKDPETPPVRSKRAKKGWSKFVTAAAKRYGPGGTYWETVFPLEHPGAKPKPIKRWQVWNEPSAQPFWHPKPRPREYGKLVKITSRALTKVDKDAYIVLAGLFGTPTVGIDQPDFIRAVYRTPRVERYFDAVAIHPYGPNIARVKFQVKWALDEIKRAGDRKADLWISEIGWASDRLHNQLGVGKKGQARMLRKALKLFKRKRSGWNIEAVNWYAWQDTDAEGFCDFCRRSGLINVKGETKPSYDAFRKIARR